MRNTDVPAEIQGGGAVGNLLNRLRKCLMRRTIIAGDGISLKETSEGVVVTCSAISGPIFWIKCCLEDGSICYVPVRVAGDPRRTLPEIVDEESPPYDAATIVEEDVPEGSIVLQ